MSTPAFDETETQAQNAWGPIKIILDDEAENVWANISPNGIYEPAGACFKSRWPVSSNDVEGRTSEDQEDIAAARRVLANSDPAQRITLDDLKAELGL